MIALVLMKVYGRFARIKEALLARGWQPAGMRLNDVRGHAARRQCWRHLTRSAMIDRCLFSTIPGQ